MILFLSLSLALCRLGELVELDPEAFRGLAAAPKALLLLVEGVGVAELDTAAFSVLSNICNNFRVSGPNFEGSPSEAAKGENKEDMAAAALDLFTGGVAEPAGVVLVVGGMNRPGCNMTNRLCC